jgi:hypothetical protein
MLETDRLSLANDERGTALSVKELNERKETVPNVAAHIIASIT